MSDPLIDAIAAVEAGQKSRKWFEETYLTNGVLYVTHAQHRAIKKIEDAHPLGLRQSYELSPRPSSIQIVIRDR